MIGRGAEVGGRWPSRNPANKRLIFTLRAQRWQELAISRSVEPISNQSSDYTTQEINFRYEIHILCLLCSRLIDWRSTTRGGKGYSEIMYQLMQSKNLRNTIQPPPLEAPKLTPKVARGPQEIRSAAAVAAAGLTGNGLSPAIDWTSEVCMASWRY